MNRFLMILSLLALLAVFGCNADLDENQNQLNQRGMDNIQSSIENLKKQARQMEAQIAILEQSYQDIVDSGRRPEGMWDNFRIYGSQVATIVLLLLVIWLLYRLRGINRKKTES